MFTPDLEEHVMTAVDARARLQRLEVERLAAVDAGLTENATYMDALMHAIEASRTQYVGLAVTELATFRAELHGRQEG